MPRKLAFALAGLGGFNAHGAGFLTAARELGIRPDLVTATSGQILVVDEWLRGGNLEALLIDPGRPAGPLGTLATALGGYPGVFRPAVAEYWGRWARSVGAPEEFAAALFPAQEYVPLRTTSYHQSVADRLNAADVGVVFNTYDPRSGEGTLFGNAAARGRLADEPLSEITAQAVAAALWLSLYGFDGLPGGRMDGAYHRSCIVAELSVFDLIFAVRPLARGWRGKAPASWFDVQDWQTEMWFSASYEAEVADMRRINDLLRRKLLEPGHYRPIELVEVLTSHPAGFFNYFVERQEVFAEARREGRARLIEHLGIVDPSVADADP